VSGRCRGGLRREGDGSCPGEGTGELGEDDQVGVCSAASDSSTTPPATMEIVPTVALIAAAIPRATSNTPPTYRSDAQRRPRKAVVLSVGRTTGGCACVLMGWRPLAVVGTGQQLDHVSPAARHEPNDVRPHRRMSRAPVPHPPLVAPSAAREAGRCGAPGNQGEPTWVSRPKSQRTPPRSGRSLGRSPRRISTTCVQALARYWADEYDWRKCEERLDALPHFITEIDGLDIHFIHVRSEHEDALR
jgi:hypothetical protein